MSSDSELQARQKMSRIPRPVPPRRQDDREDASDVLRTHELPVSRPLLYQPPDTRTCYFYRDGHSNSAPVKIVVNRRVYPTFDVLKDELTRRVDGLPFGVRGIYTPAGRDALRSLSDLQQDGRYVCTTVAAKARGVNTERADAFGGQVWRTGARPGSDGQRRLNAMLRRTDDNVVQQPNSRCDAPDVVGRRLAWHTSDSASSDKSAAANDQPLTPRSHKKITVMRHGDTTQKHTLLLYKRTSQTFEQVLSDLSGMFKAPVRSMFTADSAQVDFRFSITSVCIAQLTRHFIYTVSQKHVNVIDSRSFCFLRIYHGSVAT